MNISSVQSGIKATLENHLTGVNVYDYVPEKPVAPAVIIDFPAEIDYNIAMGRSAEAYVMELLVIVGSQVDKSTQQRLSEFAASSGERSITTALWADKTLNGSCSSSNAMRSHSFGATEIAGIRYVSYRIELQVIGTGR